MQRALPPRDAAAQSMVSSGLHVVKGPLTGAQRNLLPFPAHSYAHGRGCARAAVRSASSHADAMHVHVLQMPRRRHIRDFALVKEIGSGAVSCVYYALCRKSCLRVAIKVYNKTKLTKLNARQVGPDDIGQRTGHVMLQVSHHYGLLIGTCA